MRKERINGGCGESGVGEGGAEEAREGASQPVTRPANPPKHRRQEEPSSRGSSPAQTRSRVVVVVVSLKALGGYDQT